MRKSLDVVCFTLLKLDGCASLQPPQGPLPASEHVQRACEQKALMAQERYLARIKTPDYSHSYSTTWAGGARSDTGMRVFHSALNRCLRHAHHAAGRPH